MSTTYDFDDKAASAADNAANRVDQNGAYVGQFKSVHAIKSANTGTEGLHFEFNTPGGGSVGFDIYTRKADGSPTFGMNQVQAMMAVLGLRGLQGQTGKFEGYNRDTNKREEMEGEVFPSLCNKDIGLVFQKELYTKQDGKEGSRMNIFGIFQSTTKLTASELKEGKAKPEKLERMLASLKTKDSRKAASDEPAQPSVGASGGY